MKVVFKYAFHFRRGVEDLGSQNRLSWLLNYQAAQNPEIYLGRLDPVLANHAF